VHPLGFVPFQVRIPSHPSCRRMEDDPDEHEEPTLLSIALA
jgi:hypothetical protein